MSSIFHMTILARLMCVCCGIKDLGQREWKMERPGFLFELILWSPVTAAESAHFHHHQDVISDWYSDGRFCWLIMHVCVCVCARARVPELLWYASACEWMSLLVNQIRSSLCQTGFSPSVREMQAVPVVYTGGRNPLQLMLTDGHLCSRVCIDPWCFCLVSCFQSHMS